MDDTSQVRSQVKLRTGVSRLGTHNTGLWPKHNIFIHPCLQHSAQMSPPLVSVPDLPGRVKYSLWSPSLPHLNLWSRLWFSGGQAGCSISQTISFWTSSLLLCLPAQPLTYSNYMEYVFSQNEFLKLAKSEEVMSFTRIMFAHSTFIGSFNSDDNSCVTHTQELSNAVLRTL